MKVSKCVGQWSLTAQGSKRSALMWKRHELLLCGKMKGKQQGIFSGLFGIIEVRPSAGVCVGGALVIQRGGRRRGGKERERGFGP